MKDAFTSAYSDLIQNQIELGSTLQSIIEESALRAVPDAEIDNLRAMVASFNARTNDLARRLMERYTDLD